MEISAPSVLVSWPNIILAHMKKAMSMKPIIRELTAPIVNNFSSFAFLISFAMLLIPIVSHLASLLSWG